MLVSSCSVWVRWFSRSSILCSARASCSCSSAILLQHTLLSLQLLMMLHTHTYTDNTQTGITWRAHLHSELHTSTVHVQYMQVYCTCTVCVPVPVWGAGGAPALPCSPPAPRWSLFPVACPQSYSSLGSGTYTQWWQMQSIITPAHRYTLYTNTSLTQPLQTYMYTCTDQANSLKPNQADQANSLKPKKT